MSLLQEELYSADASRFCIGPGGIIRNTICTRGQHSDSNSSIVGYSNKPSAASIFPSCEPMLLISTAQNRFLTQIPHQQSSVQTMHCMPQKQSDPLHHETVAACLLPGVSSIPGPSERPCSACNLFSMDSGLECSGDSEVGGTSLTRTEQSTEDQSPQPSEICKGFATISKEKCIEPSQAD